MNRNHRRPDDTKHKPRKTTKKAPPPDARPTVKVPPPRERSLREENDLRQRRMRTEDRTRDDAEAALPIKGAFAPQPDDDDTKDEEEEDEDRRPRSPRPGDRLEEDRGVRPAPDGLLKKRH